MTDKMYFDIESSIGDISKSFSYLTFPIVYTSDTDILYPYSIRHITHENLCVVFWYDQPTLYVLDNSYEKSEAFKKIISYNIQMMTGNYHDKNILEIYKGVDTIREFLMSQNLTDFYFEKVESKLLADMR